MYDNVDEKLLAMLIYSDRTMYCAYLPVPNSYYVDELEATVMY